MITVLQPDTNVVLDRFEGWITDAGEELKVIALGHEELPKLAECGQGIIILGGTMDALDQDRSPWLPALHDLLHEAKEAELPVFGICLGHQIIADCFGGEVTVDHKDEAEVGARKIVLTEAGKLDPVLGAMGASAYLPEHHQDVVTALPPEAVLLASSASCKNQSFRLGSLVTAQFHPEASPATMERWELMSEDGKPEETRQEMENHDAEVAASGKALARAFVGLTIA